MVKIRMKRFGRTHRPYFRICVMDSREARDGKAIEEVGTYDPMIADKDKRCTMKSERIDYWLSVGAQASPKVKALLDKYKGKVPEKRVEPRKTPAIIERLSAMPRRSADAPKPAEEAAVPAAPPAAVAEAPVPAPTEG